MGQRLSLKDNELYKRVDEVLHYIWDPIGVAGEPYARDEYNSYLPQVFSLLKSTTDGKDIAKCLLQIESDNMGLAPSHDRARKVSNILLKYRKKIDEASS